VPAHLGGMREGYVSGPDEQELRLVERIVDLGEDGRFLVSVAGDSAEIDDESDNFNDALIVTFATLALAFVLTVWFQVRFGLRPLDRISSALAAVRSGRAERLDETFPEEIAPLAREVNALLDSNREIVERARTHVGNLAHALKTPLSVLRNEAAARDDPLSDKVREQVGVMHDQVQHHLERARIAARVAVVAATCEVRPVVEAIVRSMEKIYRERGVAIDLVMPDDLVFHGERQDLEEMLGNLVDNACKWARKRVAIDVAAEPGLPAPAAASPAAPVLFHIHVDDDGAGLPPEWRRQAPERGRRLDEGTPGSGLGLSIVMELATLYRGRLELEAAPLGGLRASLYLPRA
jgi:signal transduction histidine kinase